MQTNMHMHMHIYVAVPREDSMSSATDLLDVHKQLTCMYTTLLSDQLERMASQFLRARMRQLGDRLQLWAKARG